MNRSLAYPIRLTALSCLFLMLLAACGVQQPDLYTTQRQDLQFQAEQHAVAVAEQRSAFLEPFTRALLAGLLLAPLMALGVGLDAYRLRRRLVIADAAGKLPMPRSVVEQDPRPAMAALGAFHATEYQRARGIRSLPLAPSAPALMTSQPDVPMPTLPDRCDLLQALKTFTPSTEQLLMGVSTTGPVYRSIEQLLHVGVLGSSGSGKSTSQLAIACQLAMIDGATMAVLDPEASTFQALRNSPRLHLPFPEDGAACVENLQALQGELNERRAVLSSAGAWDWQEYNREHSGTMTPVFGFVDELPTLTGYPDTEGYLLDLARRGRKCGMYLVIASQSLKREDVGSTTIRQQLATKLLLRTGETAQGRALGLDTTWCKQATAFSEPGLAVYATNDAQPEVIRVPYVRKSDAAHILKGATIAASTVTRQVASARTIVTDSDRERGEPRNRQFTACESSEPEFKTAPNVPEIAGIVQRLRAEGRGKNAIIETVWGAKPGGTRAYREASEHYRRLIGA